MVQWVKQISDTLLLSIKKAENATSKRHKRNRETEHDENPYQLSIKHFEDVISIFSCVCLRLPSPNFTTAFLTISQIFNDQIMSSLRAPYPFIFYSTFSALVFFFLVHTKTQQYTNSFTFSLMSHFERSLSLSENGWCDAFGSGLTA